MVVGLMRRCSCTATCFEPSVVVGVETRLGQGGGRSGPGVAAQAAAGICRGGRWVRSAPADPGEILQREREHHDCHGLNYFAEILEKLNGIILLIGNLGIDFSPEKVDRGSDNGRNTAAREEIIIWKILDEEEAKVGRSIEQEFQTQVTPRTSASDHSFFRQRKDHSPSPRVAHLRATRGCPRPVRRDHPSSDLTASTKM
ncbi:uncharacterized protein [Triticum aestivum]|uniref:uncharacterized protein isoform X1 n=1 Tax=Triticum aestivum TaxID=4565 RepID=UPI001D00D132|nr:uncharacterized protein LOC123119819 isoform X1 [Triticum aestivum]XP_044395686.1 uncharacterized protein LOC123119819 isoform X1 [Triticum aestivum]